MSGDHGMQCYDNLMGGYMMGGSHHGVMMWAHNTGGIMVAVWVAGVILCCREGMSCREEKSRDITLRIERFNILCVPKDMRYVICLQHNTDRE